MGASFIAQATKDSGCKAFATGTPLEMTTLDGSPDRCRSRP